jgi:hypothetical protein
VLMSESIAASSTPGIVAGMISRQFNKMRILLHRSGCE